MREIKPGCDAFDRVMVSRVRGAADIDNLVDCVSLMVPVIMVPSTILRNTASKSVATVLGPGLDPEFKTCFLVAIGP